VQNNELNNNNRWKEQWRANRTAKCSSKMVAQSTKISKYNYRAE